jgi:hypothetical protein
MNTPDELDAQPDNAAATNMAAFFKMSSARQLGVPLRPNPVVFCPDPRVNHRLNYCLIQPIKS